MKTRSKFNVINPRECFFKLNMVHPNKQESNKFNRQGFTLVELIVVCAILGVLVALAIPVFSMVKNKAETARCEAEIRTIEKNITAFFIDRSVLPDQLSDIPGQGEPLDPWKNKYQYNNTPGTIIKPHLEAKYNADFDLFSKGFDGLTEVDSDPFTAPTNNDIIRGGDGGYVGMRDY